MKKFCITFLSFAIIIVSAVCATGCFSAPSDNGEYLRIHIRANSDLAADQEVKYAVRDAVVDYLTPLAATAQSASEAETLLAECLDGVCAVAKRVLSERGFTYGARASLKTERFPTRVYGELTLQEGEYRALIVELGEGDGQNWWCVVYPPLCFAGRAGEQVRYKSKIMEIIEKWRNT